MRLIVRREQPHPHAQLPPFEEADRWPYQVVTTKTIVGQLAFLEARTEPMSGSRTVSATRWTPAWNASPPERRDQHRLAQLAAISADLIAWLRLLALTPSLAKAEPKSLGSCTYPPD
jgi:hypothetical protein